MCSSASPNCVVWHMWPLSAGVTGDGAAGLCDRQRLAASGACDQGARAALIRSRAQTAPRSRSAMHAIDGVRGAVNVVRRRNRRRFRDRAISVCDRDLGPSHHTGQALILIPRATAAVVLRRPVPRSRADSPIAQIRANDRDRGLGPVGLADNREEDSRPTGVIRPSGRRRRRPTGSAPRRRTDPRTELG